MATNWKVFAGDCLFISAVYKVNGLPPPNWPTGYLVELSATWDAGSGPDSGHIEYDSDDDPDQVTLTINGDGDASIVTEFPGSVTKLWPIGDKKVNWDLTCTWPDNCRRTLLSGKITAQYSANAIAEDDST